MLQKCILNIPCNHRCLRHWPAVQLAFLFWLVSAGAADVSTRGVSKALQNVGCLSVFPVATNNQLIEASFSLASDGTNYLVGLLSGSDVVGQLISPSGTPIGSSVNVGQSRGFPSLAANRSNYLLVWSDDFASVGPTVLGQLLSPTGTKIGAAFPISQGPGTGSFQEVSTVSSDGTNYVVLWRNQVATARNHYAQMVSRAGALVGPALLINDNPYSGHDAAVAFDGTNYLVVSSRKGPTITSQVYGQFLSRAGARLGRNFLIQSLRTPNSARPALAFDGARYLVVFSDELGGPGSGAWDTFGKFVTPGGTVLTNKVPIATGPGAQGFPALAFDGSNYLISWSVGLGTTNSNYRFRFLNAAGKPMSSDFSVFPAHGTNRSAFGGLLFDGRRYAVVGTLGTVSPSIKILSGEVFGAFAAPFPKGAFPLAITSGREMAFSAAFDGTNYLVGIQGDADAHYNITAQMFSPTGDLIGPRIFNGRTGGTPFLGFNGTNYLMVWEDDANSPNEDIYGQLISRSGTLVGGAFGISTAARKQSLSGFDSVASDGTNFLSVWEDGRNGDDNRAIYGALISPTGTLPAGNIAISADAETKRLPAVAFGKTNYLVIWQSKEAAPTELYNVYGAMLTRTGQPGTPFLISQSPSSRYNPSSAAFDGVNFLVVWSRTPPPPAPSEWDVYGRLVSPAGSALGNEVIITTAPGDQPLASVIYDGSHYLVSWPDWAAGCAGFQHRFFNTDGAPVGSAFTLFGSQGPRIPLAGLVWNGRNFLALANMVEWVNSKEPSDGDVYGFLFSKPHLELTGPLANGQLPLRFSGIPGVDVSIQASSDLKSAPPTWATLITTNAPDGSFDFMAPANSPAARSFYRAFQR